MDGFVFEGVQGAEFHIIPKQETFMFVCNPLLKDSAYCENVTWRLKFSDVDA